MKMKMWNEKKKQDTMRLFLFFVQAVYLLKRALLIQ